MQFHGRYTRMLMSRSESRFIANAELWSALRDHVTRAKGVRAAIAYFGRNGAKLLPLKKGDTIVVDMSLGAVRQGVTDPRAVRTLMQRGVAVFSRHSLHAKFVVAGRTLIASSANVSRNSREILDEAGIRTTDPAALRRAGGFFESLCTEPVGERYLGECIKEYRPPRFKAAADRTGRRGRSQRASEAKLWFVGGLAREEETPLMQRLEKRAQRRLRNPDKSEVGWIHYGRKPKFLRGFRLGDWVVQCIKDGNSRDVGPPAQVLSVEEGKSVRGKKYAAAMLELHINGESMTLGQFRKKIKAIEPTLDHPSPRTRPIPNNDHADRILRLWTAGGKIAR